MALKRGESLRPPVESRSARKENLSNSISFERYSASSPAWPIIERIPTQEIRLGKSLVTCAPGVWYIVLEVLSLPSPGVRPSPHTMSRRRKATLAPLFRRICSWPRQVDHYYYWRCTTRVVSGSFRLQYILIEFKTPGAWFQNIIPHLLPIQGVERVWHYLISCSSILK